MRDAMQSNHACAIILLSCLLAVSPQVAAYTLDTHELVNSEAAVISNLNLILKEQLGVKEGIEAELLGYRNSVRRWLREGGSREDDGSFYDLLTGRARYLRHFHDPLRPWDQAGLHPILPLFSRWESAVRWAQETTQQAQTGLGDYSYTDARRYLLTALTDPDPTQREAAFAQTFRALGQVMHLLADLAVPDHARDDMHLLDGPGGYEGFVLGRHQDPTTGPAFTDAFLRTPLRPAPELFGIPVPSGESVAVAPIARLFDSDRYLGTNPQVTAEPLIGIAEVANANFFSGDTLSGQYPHPAIGNLETYIRPYSQTGTKRYYRKQAAGLTVDPIAVECSVKPPTGEPDMCLDEDVWLEYARHLLPRAVGYSAALLDHFFRGKVDFWIYPASNNPSQFVLYVVNYSSEPMAGSFALYTEDREGRRLLVREAALENIILPATATPDDPFANTTYILFTPDPSLRLNSLTLVFTGTLGTEEGAVVGKVKPWEPGILLVQKSAEIIGRVDTDVDLPRLDNETGKLYDGWRGTASMTYSQDPRLQRAEGEFLASDGAVAGEFLQRVWFETGGSSGLRGITLRINGVDVGLDWRRDTGPPLIPATWQIEADTTPWPDPGYGYYGLPTILSYESLNGTVWQVPLLWWRKKTSGASSFVDYGAGDCMRDYGVLAHTRSGSGSSVAVLGASPGSYRAVAGYFGLPIGTFYILGELDHDWSKGCPNDMSILTRSARVFLDNLEEMGQAGIGQGIEAYTWVSWFDAGNPPALNSAPPLPNAPIQFRRDFSPFEAEKLRRYGISPDEEYITTLR